MKIKKLFVTILTMCALSTSVFAFTNAEYITAFFTAYRGFEDQVKYSFDKNDDYMLGEYKDSLPSYTSQYKKYSKFSEWTTSNTEEYNKITANIEKMLPAKGNANSGLDFPSLSLGKAKSTKAPAEEKKQVFDENGKISWKNADWKNFCGSIESGDMFVNAGIGVSATPIIALATERIAWEIGSVAHNTLTDPTKGKDVVNLKGSMTPVFDAHFEYAQKVLFMPFTFGAFFSMAGCGLKGSLDTQDQFGMLTESKKVDSKWTFTNFGVSAKYHVNFGRPKLDIFSGLKLGGYVIANNSDGKKSSSGKFYADLIVGGSYYFTDHFGLTFETGFPEFAMLYATYKF